MTPLRSSTNQREASPGACSIFVIELNPGDVGNGFSEITPAPLVGREARRIGRPITEARSHIDRRIVGTRIDRTLGSLRAATAASGDPQNDQEERLPLQYSHHESLHDQLKNPATMCRLSHMSPF